MATERNRPNTHITRLKGKFRVDVTNPVHPVTGDMYFNYNTGWLVYYNGTVWVGALFSIV